jgi:hypothetical protein
MRRCKDQKKRKAAGILLIAIFALLQLALWGPSFLHALSGKEVAVTCQHDHALCGCSPSRIASATCCCALVSVLPCCQKESTESALEEKTHRATAITSLPCGGSEDPLVTTSCEDYLLPILKISDCSLVTTVYPLLAATKQADLHLLPPIPPPKA